MATDLSARIDEWRSQLLDTTKRNRLISLKLGRTGAIKLVHPTTDVIWDQLVAQSGAMSFPFKHELVGEPEAAIEADLSDEFPSVFDPESETKPGERIDLSRCLESPRLRGNDLLTDMADKPLKARLGRLALNARTSMTEQGVPTLFVAFGLLKWFESLDSQIEILSPILLFPAELERENVGSPWQLKVQEDEPVPNHSLVQLMSGDFAIRLPDLPVDEEIDSPEWRALHFAGVQNAIRHQTRWEILDECCLGIFSFQKIAMWEDLGKNQDHIASHDLCRAIAGDDTVRFAVPQGLPRARELDAVCQPAQTFHILDSDSSQHEAIEAAKRGASLVLDGPPGTGKSQTIANIIAEFIAIGKSILFVSEKSAALDVVKRRLDMRGLGDFCLECHSHKANKKQVVDELGRCLELVPETYKDYGDDLDRLVETRETLNAYVRSLHQIRNPLGLSAYQVHGRLAAIQEGSVSRSPMPAMETMNADRLRKLTDLLKSLPDSRNVIENYALHPWRESRTEGRSLNLDGDIEHHFGRLALGLTELVEVAPLLGGLGFLPPMPTIRDWLKGLELAQESPGYPLVPPEWFMINPRQVAAGYIRLDQLSREYRQAREGMPEFAEEAVIAADHVEIEEIKWVLEEHKTGLLPHDNTTIASLRDHIGFVADSLRTLLHHVVGTDEALNRVLGVLGAKPRPIPVGMVGQLHDILGLVGGGERILRPWLDPQQRSEIRRLLELCHTALPEFSEPKVLGLDARSIKQFVVPLEGNSTILKPHGKTTARSLLEHLDRILPAARTMAERFAKSEEALNNVLAVLGLSKRPLVARGLRKVHELFDIVGNAGVIQRSWLDPQERKEIRRILDLCRTALPEFSELRVIGQNAGNLAAFTNLHKIDTMFLPPEPALTVIGLRDHLDRAIVSLRTLKEHCARAEEALNKVQATLGLSKRPLAVRGLGKCLELLAMVSTVAPIPRPWLDAQQRKEVQRVLERCRDEETVMAEVRFRLLDRLLPIAFGPEAASLASRCQSYRAGWKRLLPGWWPLKRKLADFYGGRVPETSILIEDMVQLTDYHRRISYVRQVKHQFADRLVLNEAGEIERERTIEGMRTAEQIDAILVEIPDLKEILVNPGRVDRVTLQTNLDELACQWRKFEESVELSSQHLDLGIVFGPEAKLSHISTADFAGLLKAELSKLEDWSSRTTRFCSLLKPGHDVLLADLPSRIKTFDDVCITALRNPTDHFALLDDGQIDRVGTEEGMGTAERLDPLIRAFPDLKGILVAQAGIDRFALIEASEGLRRSQDNFRESMTDSDEHLDWGIVFGPEGRLSRISTTDFAMWLKAELSSVESGFVKVMRVCSLLKPGHDVLLADLALRFEAFDEVSRSNLRNPSDYILLDQEGALDEKPNNEGLRVAERLDPLLRTFPELMEVIVGSRRVDPVAFNASRDELTLRHSGYRKALSAVDRHFDLSGIYSQGDLQSKTTANDFAAWIEAELAKLEARLTALNRLCALLKPDRSVPVREMAKRMESIHKLRQVGSIIASLASELGLMSMTVEAVRDRDWDDYRLLGAWTVDFLDKFADRPPPSLIRAATSPELREPLQEAVRRNLAIRSDSFLESWRFLTELFDPEQVVSTGVQVGKLPITELSKWVAERLRDASLIREWVQFGELRERLLQAGLGPMLDELVDHKLRVEDAGDAFLGRFYRCWLDWVYGQDSALRRFSVEDHERTINRFRGLDRDSVRLSYTRIRAGLLSDSARPSIMGLEAPNSSELGVLIKEINKKRRHLPLRHLFARMPTVLTRLKPCLMMSPLAVSTYLDTQDIRFDLVIFDEASQVRPFDAISAIYRGKQLVVAGDQKQLPPTSFFERSIADEDLSSDEQAVSEDLTDFESILDVCCTLGLAHRRLRWHYRSRREPLIAFSNHHIYDNELVTFPSVFDTGENPAVEFEHVEAGQWKSGKSGGFNAVEAKRTAELVMRHFRESPLLSLGVIAFSQRQQTAILDELERLRRLDLEMEGFFRADSEEPFFVKNLENVQGDERDVIFLSVGYGPDENGRVSMRFGPLNRQGGERRLNVAITRSRSAMRVISSMKSQDIDLSRTASVGPKLLRAYLDFAERGISALGSEISQVDEHDFDSPFEKEVADALARRGLAVRRQIGCSGFRIDLALVDPEHPGRFLLGIECDGATYHSSATARD